jgi:hypothetical protein
MTPIGAFKSVRWGVVNVLRATYGGPKGPTAIVLQTDDGEPLATLSVNSYKPECSQNSTDLPADCFYVKAWSENGTLAEEARTSGLFIERPDMPLAEMGFVTAPVWQIKPA